MKYLATLVFAFLLASSFSQLKAQNVYIDEKAGFNIEKANGKELIISFTAVFENVSTRGAGVTVRKGKMYKNGEYFGSFRVVDKIKLTDKTKDKVEVRVKVQLEKDFNILEEAAKALFGKTIEFKISGVFKATKFIFWKKYPFEYEKKFSINDLMSK